MKSIDLKGHLRDEIGKKGSKKIRQEGSVPCELYGKENVHFYVSELELRKVIYTPETFLIKLDVDGTSYDVVMREIQFHPVTDKPLHIDFEFVSSEHPVKVELPVKTSGTAPGVINGGRLKINIRKILVKGDLDKIPEDITVDISKLRIGHSVRVKDLAFEGVTFLDAPNNVLVAVATARGAVDEDEVAEGEEETTEEGATEAKAEAAEE